MRVLTLQPTTYHRKLRDRSGVAPQVAKTSLYFVKCHTFHIVALRMVAIRIRGQLCACRLMVTLTPRAIAR